MLNKNLVKPLLTKLVAVFVILTLIQIPFAWTDSTETKPKKMKSRMPMKGCG